MATKKSTVEILSEDDAQAEMKRLRSTTGESMYTGLLEELEENLEEGNTASLTEIAGESIRYTRVAGLRSHLQEHGTKPYKVMSVSNGENSGGDSLYRVFVFLKEDEEE